VLDARTGGELFNTRVPRSIRASPMTCRANGKHYVAFVASSTIHAFGLKQPSRPRRTRHGFPAVAREI